ncbi:MAG: MCE family protein [Pseudomonadota bacterium]|nr:MCE family protein [Pseudomonadota bacterium]
MERRANYTAVGAFVLLALGLAGGFVYWYSEGRDSRNYERYEIYFPGSVTGLSEGSSVRYLGVEVGKIRRIRLDPRSPDRVQVIADIDQSAPISGDTAASLSVLSFATGLLYIDLLRVGPNATMLPPVPSERYPVIASMRSGFDAFLNALPELAGTIAELLDSAQEVFSSENAEAMSEMIQNLHSVTKQLPTTMSRANALLGDMAEATRAARSLAANLDSTTGQLAGRATELIDRLNITAQHLDDAASNVSAMVQDNRPGLASFTQQGLPQLQLTLESAQQAAEELRDLARGLKENPSQLIYRAPSTGVEVPR